jgi:Recombination endonuclease VII
VADPPEDSARARAVKFVTQQLHLLMRDAARASRLRLYNLTITEWDIIDAFQNHVCAICKQPNKSGQRLSTDHSHFSGLIRGLLCQRCNRILGKIEQPRFWGSPDVKIVIAFLRAAADFLEHPTAVQALGKEVFTFPGKFGTKRHRDWLKALRKSREIRDLTAASSEGKG